MHYVRLSDVVAENGKTIRENNLEKTHNIPIGTLVEVKHSEWHGDGACSLYHERLWVVSHDRDCDGTPLYSLCHRQNTVQFTEDGEPTGEGFDHGILLAVYKDTRVIPPQSMWTYLALLTKIIHNWRQGFTEENMTVVNLTEDLKIGHGSLEW